MTYYSNANSDLVILADPTAAITVELGCGTGATAAAIRLLNPTGRFIGIEAMPGPAANARNVFETLIEGDIEAADTFDKLDKALAGEPINLLVIGDVLEHLKDPWSVMRHFHQRMAPGGRLILSLPNVSHWSMILRQLKGDWTYTDSGLLDRTHLRYFTCATGHRMLTEAGWHVNRSRPRIVEKPQGRQMIDALSAVAPQLGVSAGQIRRELSALQWIHCAAATPIAAPHSVYAIGIAAAMDSLTTVRLQQPLESLQAMGRINFQLCRGSFQLPDLVRPPGILLTYRLHPDAAQWDQLERLIRRGWLFIHDVDDHPAYLKAQKRLDFRSIREAHAVTVSTPALAEICRQWNENVHVVPNQIRSLAPHDVALRQHDHPRVFLGGINRQDQWPEGARDAVLSTLRAHRIKTTVIADAAFQTGLGEGCTLLPLQSYDAYRARLAEADIALVPLLPSEFTACKSDLKIIECLASGVVPLCSAYAASRTEVPNDFLLLAEEPEDWSRQLLRLFDRALRTEMQAAGYKWVGRNRMWAGAAPALEALYSKLWSKRSELEADRRARTQRTA